MRRSFAADGLPASQAVNQAWRGRQGFPLQGLLLSGYPEASAPPHQMRTRHRRVIELTRSGGKDHAAHAKDDEIPGCFSEVGRMTGDFQCRSSLTTTMAGKRGGR